DNHLSDDKSIGVVCQIRDPDHILVARLSDRLTVPASGSKTIKLSTQVPNPKLWDIETPRLYSLETKVIPDIALDGKDASHPAALDVETKRFGIRTIELTSKNGLQLNGRRVDIHGVNLHHDQ